MFTFAAINDVEVGDADVDEDVPTKEAQEFHLTEMYEEALVKMQAGQLEVAKDLLQSILQNPLLQGQVHSSSSANFMPHLRYSSLKNLAETLTKLGSDYHGEALHCYLQAVEMDDKDVVMWNRLGTLAVSLGRLFMARRAFEQGVLCSPRNWLCMEKLLEVLIAVGDELACASVAKQLLHLSPRHARAQYVRDVLEGRINYHSINQDKLCNNLPGCLPYGIDLLKPTHHSLSFTKKRRLEELETDESNSKKQRVHCIDLRISDPSWGTLARSLLGVLQEKLSLSTYCLIGGEKDSLQDLQKPDACPIVNARLQFAVSGPELDMEDVTGTNDIPLQVKDNVSHCITELNPCPPLDESPRCEEAAINKGSGADLLDGSQEDRVEVGGQAGDSKNAGRRYVQSHQDLLHERRSSRIERLRSGCSVGQDKGMELEENGKHSKDLMLLLEPFVVHPVDEEESCIERASESLVAESSPVQPLSANEQQAAVKVFLRNQTANSGVYDVSERLLETLATCKCVADYAPVLELEKQIRRSTKRKRTIRCSLFLAELYADAAASAISEDIAKRLVEDAKYHQCTVWEDVASEVELSDGFSLGSVHCPQIGPVADAGDIGFKKGTPDSSVDNVHCDMVEDAGSGFCPIKFCLQSSPFTMSSFQGQEWPFWVRYHWLDGRIKIISGQQEQGLKRLRTCHELLETKEQMDHSVAAVTLPHCKVDCLVTASAIQKKIGGLEIVDLIRNAGTKAFEQGRFEEVIEMLSPVLFSMKGDTVEKVRPGGGCTLRDMDCSHELVGLRLVLLASRKLKPEHLILSLQCHARRLEMLCHEVDSRDGDWKEGFLLPTHGHMSVSDVNVVQEINLDCARLISEEVRCISRCAGRVRERFDSGNLEEGAVPLSLLRRLQLLILTVMGQSVDSLWQVKPGANSGAHFYGVCLVDAAVAFCRLKYLDLEATISQQVSLLVRVHDVLAEHGLCCAGEDCEGGEGTFLHMAIKHLGALDLRIKGMSCKQTPGQSTGSRDQKGTWDELDETAASEHQFVVDSEGVSDVASLPDKAHATVEVSRVVDGSGFNSAEKRRLESAIDCALDQSFFCLYGLNLRGGDITSPEGIAQHKNTNRGDYQTKDQCAGVLQYILPYVNSCSRYRLQKLKKVLRAVREQFPQPPYEVLSRNPIDLFLDDPTFDESKLYEMIMSGESVEDILELVLGKEDVISSTPHNLGQNEVGSKAREAEVHISLYSSSSSIPQVEASCLKASHGSEKNGETLVNKSREDTVLPPDPYSEVYENLYYLLAQIEDMSAGEKYPGFILTTEGEQFIFSNANLVKYDLMYNPARFESWHRLAHLYDEDVDLVLNDGSKKINACSWRRKPNYARRVEASRRRSRRCFLVSLALASTPELRSEVHGLLALVYYDNLQNVAPAYDQQQNVPTRDASWLAACERAYIQFERAQSSRPDWTHPHYQGKLAEKMGRPYTEWLAHYAKAVKMNPSAVDTFYRLHASRIKLLCKKQLDDIGCLQVLAQYSYLAVTKEKVAKYLGSHGSSNAVSEENLGKAWKVLFDDCMAALQMCIEGDLKHYHKARYRIAKGFYHLGREEDIERAKEEISFCFKSHRSPFIIYMWEIDDSSRKNKKKSSSRLTSGKKKKKPVNDLSLCRRKGAASNGGKVVLEFAIAESSRKFITCVRKYLLFYLTLCESTGDVSTLERAYITLRADKKFSICLEDICYVALGHYIRTLATAINIGRTKAAGGIAFQSLLDKMFNVCLDHGSSWWSDKSTGDARVQVSDGSIYSGYVIEYLAHLESSNNVDGLEAVNEKLRKRFKCPKLVGPLCVHVCTTAALSWCRALFRALSALTPLCPENPHTELSEPRLIVDLLPDAAVDLKPAGHGYAVVDDDANLERGAPAMAASSFPSWMRNIHVTKVAPEDLDKATTLLKSAYTFHRESALQSMPEGVNMFIKGCPELLSGFGYPPSNAHAARASQAGERVDVSAPRKLLLWAFTLVHGQPCSMADVVKYCDDQAKGRSKRGSAVSGVLSGTPGAPDVAEALSAKDAPGHVTSELSRQARDHGSTGSITETALGDV